MTFLQQVAGYIHEKELPLQHLTVVLPSERAGKYLSAALFEAYGRPVFSPEIITMDRWIRKHCPYTVIDKTRALLQLFRIQYNDAVSEEDRSFEAFMSWGTMLLSDFDEIDRYLVASDKIFRNLRDIREIEQWSFGEEELTESQKRFLEFWERLPRYYEELNKALLATDSCYAGRAFRYVAEHPDALFAQDKERIFLFAGFNALSAAEKSIIRQLDQMGRAHVLINADQWYLQDNQHEAGRFLRELSTLLDGKRLEFVSDELRTRPMKVEIIECAQNTGQVKAASTLLADFDENRLNNTLLLLADESLIDSVIRNLPKSIGKANITLGLPIRNTSVRTWVDLLFSVQENKRRFRTGAIYFSDLQHFWSHPLVLAALDKEEQKLVGQEERRIISRNRIFLNASRLEIGPLAQSLLNELVVDWESDWLLAIRQVRKLNRMLFAQLDSTYALEKAALQGFDAALVEFENIALEGLPEMSMRSFRQLFQQHWSMKSIAYHGNPTEGLQIMGLLETRALDFKNIICIGMNEGQLPPTNPIQTVIPMDLRKAFGLPSPREKQGLFAHHFYRLMHQCEELYVTYYSADELIGNNEPSRYLLQLELELARANPQVNVSKRVYALEESRTSWERHIVKTPEILQRIDELLAGSASASMWKKYLTCPLDFYFRYVMEFGEEDSVEEEIENSTFGTFIHDTLEELYTPFARVDANGEERKPPPPPLRSTDIERMLKDFRLVLEQQFMRHFNGDKEAFTKGKNLLSYQMAIELTERFLRSELNFLALQTEPVYIEALEQEYESMIEVEVNGQVKKVHLRGFIDRIDRIGDKVRIIDYKSGKVQATDVEFRLKDTDVESIVESLASRKHLLQLIQYAWLYREKHGIVPESSIISFISGGNQPFTLDTRQVPLEEVVNDYPQYIAQILKELYDPEIPFVHTEQQFSYCQYCE